MRMSRVGNVIVIAGAVVGAAAAVGIASGYHIEMTPFMTQVIIYKGIAAAAVGLLIAGSWIGRRGRQQETADNRDSDLLEPGRGAFADNKSDDPVSARADDYRGDI